MQTLKERKDRIIWAEAASHWWELLAKWELLKNWASMEDVNAPFACSSLWTSLGVHQNKNHENLEKASLQQRSREEQPQLFQETWNNSLTTSLQREKSLKWYGKRKKKLSCLWWEEADAKFLHLGNGQKCRLHLEQQLQEE